MGIYDEIKREEEELRKLEAGDGADVAPVVEEEEELPTDEGDEEGSGEEEEQEPVEPVKDPDPEPTAQEPAPVLSQAEQNAAFMRLRRENAEYQRKLKELEEAKNAKPTVNTDPEPDKAENYEGWLEWKVRQLETATSNIASRVSQSEQQAQTEYAIKKGIEEFNAIESEFRTKAPDYDAAANHMVARMKESVLLLNPMVTAAQAEQAVHQKILGMASEYAQAGMNPAEELYKLAKDRFKFVAEPPKKEAIQPQKLSKIAANAKRSASPLQGGGGASIETTLDEYLNMSNAEAQRLSPAIIKRLEEQAGIR